jgi:ribosomal protein L31E
MFAKSKVSQSMIDAVNKVLGEQPVEQKDELLNETAPIKEPTPTGMRVYGGSYGNSAKAKKDQTKSAVDNLKGPKAKELQEAPKPDFLDMDKDGNKKESMKKAVADKKTVGEELTGNQHKIDANNNNKIDGQDFKILRGKKKVKEGREFTEKLLEMVRKSDVPAYLRKAKGDTPLTMADAKGPKKDSISAPENLAKARNEEVVTEAKGIEVKKEYDDKKEAEHGVYHNGQKIGYVVHNKKHGVHTAYHSPQGDKDDEDYGQIDDFHSHHDAVSQIRHSAGVSMREEVEHLNEDDFAHAKKQGWSVSQHYHHTKVTHPKHGIVSVDRYGEWMHHPEQDWVGRPKGNLIAHGQFHDLNKHLSSLKEEVVNEMDKSQRSQERHGDYPLGKPTGTPAKPVKAKKVVKDLHNLLNKAFNKEEVELDQQINEVLSKDASAGDYIHDFIHSDNPKFAGKSKAERKKMALGAYYGAQKEAYEPSDAPITTDTLAGRMPGGKSNSFKSFKTRVRPLDKEGNHKPEDDTPKAIQPQDTPARKSHEVKEATIAGTSGWEPMKKDVKDKSGAVHTPMSRAKDLARQAFKTVQNKTKVK